MKLTQAMKDALALFDSARPSGVYVGGRGGSGSVQIGRGSVSHATIDALERRGLISRIERPPRARIYHRTEAMP